MYLFLGQWIWPIIYHYESYPFQLSGLRAQSFSIEGGRSAIDYYEDDDDDDEDDDYIPDTETGTQNEFHFISNYLSLYWATWHFINFDGFKRCLIAYLYFTWKRPV